MSANKGEPAPVKPQGFGLETQTELPSYSPGYGNPKSGGGLAVHTQAGGQGPLKGPGLQISGGVMGVEHQDGLTTIRYEAAGRVEAVSFPSQRRTQDGREEPNPLNAVAEGVKEGDHFGLRIGREGHATLSNTTRELETQIHSDGRVETRPLVAERERAQDRGITRDAPA
jgi:hypothetical protein